MKNKPTLREKRVIDFFKPEQLMGIDMSEPKPTCRYGLKDYQAERIAKHCNELLQAHLDTLQRVYLLKNGMIVSPDPAPGIKIEYKGSVAIIGKGLLWDPERIDESD